MHLNPLKITPLLAKTPTAKPQYSVTVQDKNGQGIAVGDPRVTRALVALMNQHATIGGAAAHWGGPAAFAEIMSATHALMFKHQGKQWYENFNFVNDAGHTENGIYALRANYAFDNLTFDDLKGFRSIESKLTGHGESHLNPQGVLVSNGPLGSGLPQAQGLALGDHLIGNDRVTICTLSDGAAMEGEAKESFAAIPGLAKKGKLNPFVMIISDNNTKLSGRIDADSFSMDPTFASLSVLGWDVIGGGDGNDLQNVYTKIETALERAQKNPQQAVCIHFKTIKGFGVSATEESASGGHGYPLKAYDEKLVGFINEIFAGEVPVEFEDWCASILAAKPAPAAKEMKGNDVQEKVVSEKVQMGFARAVNSAVEGGLPVYSVSADLQGSTGIAGFHKAHPEHYIDIGVAESNMLSTAVGLSKLGLIPIVDTFAQFGVTKGNLPLTMAALSQAPVIALFSHTGFQDAADGASHQATTYFSAVSSIPQTVVVNVACSKEAEALMTSALHTFAEKRNKGETPDSVIFFLGRENHPSSYAQGLSYEWEKAQVLQEGSDATIVACGPLLAHALKAAEELRDEGKSITVINNPFVNRPDITTIAAAVKKTGGKLITVEDHQIKCGMGAQLCHALKLAGHEFDLVSLGNPGIFGQSSYQADHLYAKYAMDYQAIVQAVLKL